MSFSVRSSAVRCLSVREDAVYDSFIDDENRLKRSYSMFDSNTVLLVIDAQESFRHRPYWNSSDAESPIGRLQQLIDGARAQGIPVVQIFHVEEEGVFSL